MNIFQLSYDARLQSWYNLRNILATCDTQTRCVEIDAWWQQAPLINRHLHETDTKNWPSPWDLIVDNNYCTLARGLGIYYTLYMLGTSKLDFIIGKDDNDEDCVLVSVDNAKYILNYHPNSVLSTTLENFSVKKIIDLSELVNKIK